MTSLKIRVFFGCTPQQAKEKQVQYVCIDCSATFTEESLCLVCSAEDFWLGLQKIHSFAQQGVHTLRIDLEDWKEERHWAEYRFSVDGPSKDYSLHVSNFSGDLPDALAQSSGMSFSTRDRNNDNPRNSSCPRGYTGNHSV